MRRWLKPRVLLGSAPLSADGGPCRPAPCCGRCGRSAPSGTGRPPWIYTPAHVLGRRTPQKPQAPHTPQLRTPKHLAPPTKRGTPPIGYAGCEAPKCVRGRSLGCTGPEHRNRAIESFLELPRGVSMAAPPTSTHRVAGAARSGVVGTIVAAAAVANPILVATLSRSSAASGSGSAASCSGRSRTPSRTWRCGRSSASHSARRSGPPRRERRMRGLEPPRGSERVADGPARWREVARSTVSRLSHKSRRLCSKRGSRTFGPLAGHCKATYPGAVIESAPVYTNRLQCEECRRVSRENERGWRAYLTTDEDEPRRS